MGKAKKAHNKKIQNRNSRKKAEQTHIQRIRSKMIQEMIKQQETERKAKEETEAAKESKGDESEKEVDLTEELDNVNKETTK